MKKTPSIFLISLSVLNLMALTTPVHAGDGLTFDTGFDTGFETGFDNSYDTGFDTGFENTTTGKSESASGSSAGGSILALGLGALLLSQVGKKGKSSGDAAKNTAATNSGALNPTPSPAPTPSPSPAPTPSPIPTPLNLGPPTELTPELPAGMQAIPVLLAVGGMALYQRKKKSAAL